MEVDTLEILRSLRLELQQPFKYPENIPTVKNNLRWSQQYSKLFLFK